MRATLFLCFLLVLSCLKSSHCLSNEKSHEGKKMDLQGRDASTREDNGEQINEDGRLSHIMRGGRAGGRNTGGGTAQIARQSPSQRKSSAPPALTPFTFCSPRSFAAASSLVSICLLASTVFF